MKQQNLVLGLLALVLVFIERRGPLAQAQTVAPFPTAETCGTNLDIGAIALSPDGHYLGASLLVSHSIQIWNVKTGKTVSTITDEAIELSVEEQLTFSPDDKYILISSNSTGIILWDVLSGRKIRTFTSPNIGKDIFSISFSPDSRSILATDEGAGHSIWDVETGVEKVYVPEPGYLYSEFSPDGTLVLTQSDGPTLSIWDAKTGKPLHKFDIPAMAQGRGTFSPDGKYILVPEDDDTILADTKTYSTIHVLGAATSPWRFSPDGKYALTLKYPSIVQVWNLEKGTLVREFEAFSSPTDDVIAGFLDNKTILIAKDSSETPRSRIILLVRDIQTGTEIREFTIGITYQTLRFALTRDAKHFEITTSNPDTLTLWDSETGKQIPLDC